MQERLNKTQIEASSLNFQINEMERKLSDIGKLEEKSEKKADVILWYKHYRYYGYLVDLEVNLSGDDHFSFLRVKE